MDESAEELEPLFDYSRVQPADCACFDDDDLDSCSIFVGGKRKRGPNPTDGKGKGKEVPKDVVNLDEDTDDLKLKDEEDWLPPPPKISNVASRFQEDKTLQELRLKKQELASFAQSAEEMLKAVIESAKREVSNIAKPAIEIDVEDPPKKHVDRQKIVISIQDKDGQKQFRMYKDDKFERLFKMYSEKVKLGLDRLVFCFDGDKVGPDATPVGLSLEDDDMLEVHVKPH